MADIGEQPVDAVLAARLPIMRARSNHERINNPTIEGLMLSHTLAVAGENGPLLDLWGDSDEDDQWCDQAEAVWEAWCSTADAAGGLDLGGLIKQWNYSCWYNGEWIEQLVAESPEFRIDGLPQLRLHGIEVQRLMTPYGSQSDQSITLGIRKNAHRRPTQYWLADNYYLGSLASTGRWYPARDIIHGMDRVQSERGQTRGIPWAQSGLPLMADLRDYDAQVLDAARLTADGAVFAYTRHPDSEFADNVPRSVSWRRRQVNHLAPGWELGSVHSNQPLPQYKDFRHERMNDLGKGKGVPGMVTRLDARDHNYSSARFDYQLLGESAKHVRSTLYNPQLRRLVSLVLSEAILMGILPPSPPRFYQQFIWPALPEIDQRKSAEAETIYLRNGSNSYSEVCANGHGRRARDVIRQRQRDARRLAAAGLPSVQESTGTSTTTDSNPPVNEDTET
jgi:lambda family phage portal protein